MCAEAPSVLEWFKFRGVGEALLGGTLSLAAGFLTLEHTARGLLSSACLYVPRLQSFEGRGVRQC